MRLKESLKKDLSKLVVEGAEMIMKKEIDNNEDYKQITYGVNYCIACYEMLAEQQQNKQ